MAYGILIRHAMLMKGKDPFVEGLRRIFDTRPELKPSVISVAAGLDDSTIRKLLKGANSSPRVETAQRIAEQIGLHLSDVIAIGEHEDPSNAIAIVFALRDVSPSVRDEAVRYAKYLQAQQLAFEMGELSQGKGAADHHPHHGPSPQQDPAQRQDQGKHRPKSGASEDDLPDERRLLQGIHSRTGS